MSREALSARQLSVAVLVGGLSSASAVAGGMDWRWGLCAAPLGVLLGWLLLKKVGERPLYRGAAGGVLAALYSGWAVVLMACALRRAAGRILLVSGGEDGLGWLLALLAAPLIWMGWGKAAAFFRAVEIFWLAMIPALVIIVILAAPRIGWRYLLEPADSWWRSALSMGGVLSTGLFVLPYIYKTKRPEQGRRRGLAWLAALGLLGALLAALTAGMLSPAVAGQLREPFFVAAGVLGESARGEGLLSALWLLPDLTLAGLLSRVWGERRRPAAAAALALGLALTGITDALSPVMLSCGSLALAAITLILPGRGEKIVVPF